MQELRSFETVQAGLATFFRISARWELSHRSQMAILGIRSRTTYSRWRRFAVSSLRPETVERLSHIFGIFKALQTLFPVLDRADAWLRQANHAPGFAGKSALSRIETGALSELAAVRKYLDANLE